MNNYLFIQSRDPLSDATVGQSLETMTDLVKDNAKVTLLLVQDAVVLAKTGIANEKLEAFSSQGGTVLVDDFSLEQRGIENAYIKPDIAVSPISIVIDSLLASHKVIWN